MAYKLTTLLVICIGCSGSQPTVTISDPTTLCANALVMTKEIKEQASKIGIEPSELAMQVCSSAVTAAKLVKANILPLGLAGAPNIPTVTVGAAGYPNTTE